MRLLRRPAGPGGAERGGLAFTVLDVETTGLSPRTDRIVEIAALRTDATGAVLAEFCTLINPERDIGATRIHGIRAADVVTAPRFPEVVAQLFGLLAGSVIVGHNVAFDLRFVGAEALRSGAELPEVVTMCTMQLAPAYLEELPGRTLTGCCAAAGIPIAGAHCALADARATASLLAAYRSRHRVLPASWVQNLTLAAQVSWPVLPTADLLPVTRETVAAQRAAEVGYLARLVRQLPRMGAAHPRLEPYLAVLDQALEDRQIDPGEAEALRDAAMSLGVGGEDLLRAHQDYLTLLAQAAWADGTVTDAERADLDAVARLLGLPPDATRRALVAARSRGDDRAVAGSADARALHPGMRVCFTGAMELDRGELERRATAAGLQVVGGVSRTTDMLVVADPASLSGKARRAREVGTRIVAEPVFMAMLQRCQPAGHHPR